MAYIIPTNNKENFRSRIHRHLLNVFPVYWGTGAKAIFLSHDYKEVQIKLPFSWRTRNYVGTTFGGSMYSASDPIYMIQLIRILGKEYVVWDKSASIRFLRPAKKALYAQFLIDDKLIEDIKQEVALKKEVDWTMQVQFLDEDGISYASVSKILYIAEKSFYQQKRIQKEKKTPR